VIDSSAYVHPLANVEEGATIGANTRVWQFATVRRGARVGANCVIAQGAFIDSDVEIGDSVKLENYASVHRGARVSDEVFLGPGVILTNDRWPRATTFEGQPKTELDWQCEPVAVARRASIGAGAILLPGAAIGENAMIGAGTVVRGEIPAWAVVTGNPGRIIRIVPEESRAGS